MKIDRSVDGDPIDVCSKDRMRSRIAQISARVGFEVIVGAGGRKGGPSGLGVQ